MLIEYWLVRMLSLLSRLLQKEREQRREEGGGFYIAGWYCDLSHRAEQNEQE